MVRLRRFGLFFLVFLAVMLLGLGCTNPLPPLEGGTLVSYRWNAATEKEEIILIKPTTGSVEIKATLNVNDPKWIMESGFAVDSANDKVYQFGEKDEEEAWRIYTTDLTVPTSTNVIFSEYGTGGFGFDSYKKDELIGFRWNAATEQQEIISIDPTGGSVTGIKATLGVNDPKGIDPLGFAVDSANDKAYLYGQKEGESFSRIYTIDLGVGTWDGVPFLEEGTGGFGFDVYKTGTLIGYRWNATTEKVEIISIDPTTGSVTGVKAALGVNDPKGISPSGFAVDSANDKAYLYGQKEGESFSRIYTIDLGIGIWESVLFYGEGDGGFGFDVYK